MKTNVTTNTVATVATTAPVKKAHNIPVKCIETGIVYASSYEAGRAMNLPQSSISAVANGRQKSCHGYTFVKVEEVPETTTITRQSAVTVNAKGVYTNKNCKPVLCIETGKVYASSKAAAEDLNINPSCISSVIIGRSNTCNGMHFVLIDNVKEQLDRVTGVIRAKNDECDAQKKLIATQNETLAAKNDELATKTAAYDEIAAKLEAIRSANDIITSLEASRTEALKLLEKIDVELATAKTELNDLINNI